MRRMQTWKRTTRGGVGALLVVTLLGVAPRAHASDPRVFETPQAAAAAVLEAARAGDDAALKAIFGDDEGRLVRDGRDPAVAADRAAYVAKAAEAVAFETREDGSVLVTIGAQDPWPFPVPLRHTDAGWSFDLGAGLEEVLARRIGENELEVLAAMRAFVRAEADYARVDRDGDGVHEFAQRLLSSEGEKDGLWWQDPADPSPLGEFLAEYREYLDDAEGATPWNGYYFKVLKLQGENAPGGPLSYVINGNMIAGFALLAVPAEYRNEGVMSFLVSHHGKVYEADLGEHGLEIAAFVTAFDPDPEIWTEADGG